MLRKILLTLLCLIFLLTGCNKVVINSDEQNLSFKNLKSIGNARFNFWLTIPSDWKEFDGSENGDGYFIECENKNIDIRVYGMNDILPEDFYINSANENIVSEFVFDSGIIGWQIAKADTYVEFLYHADGRYIVLHVNYENDPAWFDKNKERIFSTAKTLRDGKRTE